MDKQLLNRLSALSQLHLTVDEQNGIASDLETIIRFIDVIGNVPTDGVEPLSHPLDSAQVLRSDTPTEIKDRDKYQELSAVTRDGHYLVPRVIDP